jgi:16S rRNA (guanine966-N2)-methyltransferase
MRVIAGSAKGRHLKSPPSNKTRPIIDRVKTALFDSLGDRVAGATMLDLFGGVGGVGIEALSRGARHVTFIEIDGPTAEILRENLHITGFSDQAEVVRGDAFAYLRTAAAQQRAFDIIYVAPPQYHQLAAQAFRQLDAAPLTRPGGLVIIQIDPHERGDLAALAPRHFLLTDERKYGSTLLLFFTHRDEASHP